MTAGKKRKNSHLLLRFSIGLMSEVKKLRNLSIIACPLDIPKTFSTNENVLNYFIFVYLTSSRQHFLTNFAKLSRNKS